MSSEEHFILLLVVGDAMFVTTDLDKTMTANMTFNKVVMLFFSFLITFWKFGPPYLGKSTEDARAVLPSPTSACWVFLCFCNPPNSQRDYIFFNMRM